MKIAVKSRTITEVHLSGTLDERSDLKAMLKGLSGKIHVYSKDITHLNSYGLKLWLETWGEVRKAGADLQFYEISPLIVTAMNLVDGFIPRREIYSICAPFYCQSCTGEINVAFTIGEIANLLPEVPHAKCPKCKSEVEFSENEDYFTFIRGSNSTMASA